MKTFLLATAALLLVAALPAMAYVQPGSLQQKAKLGATESKLKSGPVRKDWDETQPSSPASPTTERLTEPTLDPLSDSPVQEGDSPTRPVPEPGTMAMASMGLLAIGAALRHRRGR